MTVGSTNILTAITNLQSFTGNCVLNNVNNLMTSNITTTGNIQSVNLTATDQLSSTGTLGVSGACSLNSTLAVSGNCNLNNTVNVAGVATLNGAVNINNACTITKGRGRDGTGGTLNIIGAGDLVYNPSALQFGGSGWASHVFELSWQGYAHFMKSSSTAAWFQTMMIEYTGAAFGRWIFLLVLML